MQRATYTASLGKHTIELETGRLAKLASGSVVLRQGDTVLLATAESRREISTLDFFPLTVEFEEKHYAIGKIPGSFSRREGRPGERAILTSRIIDRQIRPLFPKNYRHETQVIVTALSVDPNHNPDVLAPIAASAALSVSDIPWNGPTACLRVAQVDGEFVANPSADEQKRSVLDLVLAGTKDAVMMVEAGAQQVSEELLLQAIEWGHAQLGPILQAIETLRAERGKEKREPLPDAEALMSHIDVAALAAEHGLEAALTTANKKERGARIEALRDVVLSAALANEADDEHFAAKTAELKGAFSKAEKAALRRLILDEDRRSDGRNSTTVRPITIDMHPLPRAHGSAIFTRGETQVLSTTTLGTDRDALQTDDLCGTQEERFLLHYNFPPFSTGEVKRLGAQSRREVGHGNLARRALAAVLPSAEEFPYTIRVVGDVLESNGSSSMATVCAGTLGLLDAGVPLAAPVAGVAMGLVMEGDRYRILTDILGLEDALGDMDFKVCGSKDGVTALQMDIKIGGITPALMKEALDQAKTARLHILGLMHEAMPTHREELPDGALRIVTLQVPVDAIGKLIGPGGKQIRELEALGAKLNIEEDGTVRVYSTDKAALEAVVIKVKTLTFSPQPGQEYEGEVVRIEAFGAFIRYHDAHEGLLHISQISEERLEMVEEVLRLGDKLRVKIANVDDRGKVNLLRPELEGKIAPPRAPRSGGLRR